jgi:hypothetical protein
MVAGWVGAGGGDTPKLLWCTATNRYPERLIDRIGGKQAEALRVVCGLEDGTVGLSFEERRKLAGKVLSRPKQAVSWQTFVKNHEPRLVRDLAVEVWRGR